MAVAQTAINNRGVSILLGIGNWFITTLKLLAGNKVGFIGFLGVVAITAISFIAPLVVPTTQSPDMTALYQGPSAQHWLGTDYEGKDVFQQVITGGRDIISVGFLAAAFATLLAVFLGALSGYAGGKVDSMIMWVADIFLTVPIFAIQAVLAGTISVNGNLGVAVIIAIFAWPTLTRAIRSQVLSIKERDYIEAARALDLGTSHIIFREIAPNMASYIAIHFTLAVTAAMYASVGLVFLGLVPLSGNNWGVMLNFAQSRGSIFYGPAIAYVMAPIVAIVLFQLCLLSMSRSMSEVFDPRLRRGA